MGLYGTIVVEPADQDYWPPVNREITLTLDDILLTDGTVAPFSRTQTTHTAMGRFGDVLLVNGDPDLKLAARAGEVVRLYLVNTANTRVVFNVAIPGARMKLVGGDSGRYEHEQFVQSVILAPSERVVVDVQFTEPAVLTLEHHTPDRAYPLAEITVTAAHVTPALADVFGTLRSNADMVAERDRISPMLEADPDKTVAFAAEMDMDAPDIDPGAAIVYICPMHPEVTSTEPARCPDCGMKLLPTAAPTARYARPMHPEVTSPKPARCPDCGMNLLPPHLIGSTAGHADHQSPAAHESQTATSAHHHHAGQEPAGEGIEWEDDMVEVNRMTTPANMRWILLDRDTGARNHGIAWRFRVGHQVKIRLVNEMDSDHPMHHPFHVHGAGRFLIMARDGQVEPNLVWKDTVLVRRGETVDILLDVTNPGIWMAHRTGLTGRCRCRTPTTAGLVRWRCPTGSADSGRCARGHGRDVRDQVRLGESPASGGVLVAGAGCGGRAGRAGHHHPRAAARRPAPPGSGQGGEHVGLTPSGVRRDRNPVHRVCAGRVTTVTGVTRQHGSTPTWSPGSPTVRSGRWPVLGRRRRP